jgi:F-type H+-transporting ATPase subunit b
VELDWTTIVLEIINFVVLVWILKRFLYRPVLAVIAKRRADIDEALARAEAVQSEAGAMKQQYENRLADWGREREAARETLRRELEAERVRLTAALDADLAQQRERARAADEKRLADAMRQNERLAVTQSARFAAKLLEALAGPELDERLGALIVAQLNELPAPQREALRRDGQMPTEGLVTSARALDAAVRAGVESALREVFGNTLRCRYAQDAALIAGLRIAVGPWELRANLRDELQGFAELAHG